MCISVVHIAEHICNESHCQSVIATHNLESHGAATALVKLYILCLLSRDGACCIGTFAEQMIPDKSTDYTNASLNVKESTFFKILPTWFDLFLLHALF